MLHALVAGGHIPTFLAFGTPQGFEWIILAAFGLLIFGKRLPEVGRSLGKGIVEFKKGLKGVEEEIEEQSNRPSPPPGESQPKFDPYTGKPIRSLPSDYKFDPHTGKPLETTVVDVTPQEEHVESGH